MKTIALFYLLFLILPFPPVHADDTNLTLTVSGITYSNVVFVRVTPYAVSVRHSTGIAAIPLAQLPTDLQQRFGYNPTNSAQYHRVELDAAQRVRQADSTARAQREASDRQAAIDAAAKAPKAATGSAILVRALVIQALPNGAIVTLERPHNSPDGSQFWYGDGGEGFILGLAEHNDMSNGDANRMSQNPSYVLPKLSGVYDNSVWTGRIVPIGDFDYTTTDGAYKRVPEYRLQ